MEAKKREREEQHLYLTAKASRLRSASMCFAHGLHRLLPTIRLLSTMALTWQASTIATGQRLTCLPSVFSRTRPTVLSKRGLHSISTTRRIRYDCGSWSTARTRQCARIHIYRRMSRR